MRLFIEIQEEIQTLRKSNIKSKKSLKMARLEMTVGLCLRLTH